MPAYSLTHNELLAQFQSGPELSEQPNLEIAEVFSGKFDQPIQIALRDR